MRWRILRIQIEPSVFQDVSYLVGTFFLVDPDVPDILASLSQSEWGDRVSVSNEQYPRDFQLRGLVIDALLDPDKFEPTGWRCGYRQIDLNSASEAQWHHRTLQMIEKRLYVASKRHGPPTTFGGYLLQATLACHAHSAYLQVPGRVNHYDKLSIDYYLANRVDALAESWFYQRKEI